MIIKKFIDKEKHIIALISAKELEIQLNDEISNLDILIIDKSLISIRLIKKILNQILDEFQLAKNDIYAF